MNRLVGVVMGVVLLSGTISEVGADPVFYDHERADVVDLDKYIVVSNHPCTEDQGCPATFGGLGQITKKDMLIQINKNFYHERTFLEQLLRNLSIRVDLGRIVFGEFGACPELLEADRKRRELSVGVGTKIPLDILQGVLKTTVDNHRGSIVLTVDSDKKYANDQKVTLGGCEGVALGRIISREQIVRLLDAGLSFKGLNAVINNAPKRNRLAATNN